MHGDAGLLLFSLLADANELTLIATAGQKACYCFKCVLETGYDAKEAKCYTGIHLALGQSVK